MHLLEVDQLSVLFKRGYNQITAVKGLSFSVDAGGCLAIVGESGSGKSTTAKTIMGILEKNAQVTSGSVVFQGKDLLTMKKREKKQLMGKDIAMVFQNPMTSLNPSYTVYQQIVEVYRTHLKTRADYTEEIRALLRKVELPDPDSIMGKYPHELSGGMRQRICIAMAWALNPALLIADEPTSALDVCTQAEILRLMKRMAKDSGTAIVLITHDLGVVAELADRVMVLYAGECMEMRDIVSFFQSPQHPYARGLLMARPHNFDTRFHVIEGSLNPLQSAASPCAFYERCRERTALCETCCPPDVVLEKTGFVRCHLASVENGGM